MRDLIQILREQGLALPMQVLLLVVDGYLFVTNKTSSFLFISTVLTVSIFVLQVVRGRFLLLHPRNSWAAGRGTSEWDTYYLRFIIIGATLFTFLALYSGFKKLETWQLGMR